MLNHLIFFLNHGTHFTQASHALFNTLQVVFRILGFGVFFDSMPHFYTIPFPGLIMGYTWPSLSYCTVKPSNAVLFSTEQFP